ncbi:MAG: adenosylcobalamin-dependent ribonucleoside-diphosphate reductase [Chitinivibrionales bacterium]|nr:adenosylcobalamin-dependent ribonucleoside-diphosphate reductase [Chitinivibrionales bacterium]
MRRNNGAGGLSRNAREVLSRRYLLKNDKGEVVEQPNELFARVASAVSEAEESYGGLYERDDVRVRFYEMMRSREFMPNSPTLMNAGTALGQLSACFVLPVEDSLDGIFGALHAMARIHQSGGGTGFDFSHLRPRGDLVATTKGTSSGPVSFMAIFNTATDVIMQGGRRRGANMAILRCDHPDIFEFITAKRSEGVLANFNVSVAATDSFMDAVRSNDTYGLVNPRTGRTVRRVRAREVFDAILSSAWETGDPGLLFIDTINRHNPTPKLGPMEAVNPCGELPLLPYESCNLGSINLDRMVRGGDVDWDKLRTTVGWAVRFLDDVIDVNKYPLPQTAQICRANRKIGLGVMGFADMLIRLGVPYASPEAVAWAQKIMRFIRTESERSSVELAAERGSFPNFERSVYAGRGPARRNASLNSIAPTGTISIISGCSSGIEPLFAVSYVRNVLDGAQLLETHPLFREAAEKAGVYTKEMLVRIARSGSPAAVPELPESLRKVFTTAFDVAPEQHVRIQAAFQQSTDNAVSKTINLAHETGVTDVERVYLMAHELGCKGITVYRYGSKEGQVLTFPNVSEEGSETLVAVNPEYAGGCAGPDCG